jgi:hypothetical protein
MVGGTVPVTVTVVEPNLVESWVDVAVIVAVPVVVGVNTPVLFTFPMFEGLTDQLTELLKPPVPVTVGVHVDVCVIAMEVGEQETLTDVIGDTPGFSVNPAEVPAGFTTVTTTPADSAL